nr:MAG TPA: hypothetical protein [Caudoviricetes sp.]
MYKKYVIIFNINKRKEGGIDKRRIKCGIRCKRK